MSKINVSIMKMYLVIDKSTSSMTRYKFLLKIQRAKNNEAKNCLLCGTTTSITYDDGDGRGVLNLGSGLGKCTTNIYLSTI